MGQRMCDEKNPFRKSLGKKRSSIEFPITRFVPAMRRRPKQFLFSHSSESHLFTDNQWSMTFRSDRAVRGTGHTASLNEAGSFEDCEGMDPQFQIAWNGGEKVSLMSPCGQRADRQVRTRPRVRAASVRCSVPSGPGARGRSAARTSQASGSCR